VLIAVSVEITALWHVIVCSLVDTCQYFEGTFYLHVQGRMKNLKTKAVCSFVTLVLNYRLHCIIFKKSAVILMLLLY
jgi:hypothetical protein